MKVLRQMYSWHALLFAPKCVGCQVDSVTTPRMIWTFVHPCILLLCLSTDCQWADTCLKEKNLGLRATSSKCKRFIKSQTDKFQVIFDDQLLALFCKRRTCCAFWAGIPFPIFQKIVGFSAEGSKYQLFVANHDSE